MRRAGTLLVVASLVLTGCLSGPAGGDADVAIDVVETGRAAEARSSSELWIAWVHGNETRTVVEGEPSYGVCDVAWDHGIVPGNRTLFYDRTRYPGFSPDDAWGLLVTDHWDHATACPIAYGLHEDPSEGAVIQLGPPGNLTVILFEDGTLAIDGQPVAQGQAAHVAYAYTQTEQGTTYRHEGELVAEVLGAWPAENVRGQRG